MIESEREPELYYETQQIKRYSYTQCAIYKLVKAVHTRITVYI